RAYNRIGPGPAYRIQPYSTVPSCAPLSESNNNSDARAVGTERRQANAQGITHWWFGQSSTARVAKEWEMLTPVKNNDGTWSFKSRWNKWMSAVREGYDGIDVSFEPHHERFEHWLLE
ncbi:hypothetical protein PRIPAC_89882, partial [Pristionchus pacificus]